MEMSGYGWMETIKTVVYFILMFHLSELPTGNELHTEIKEYTVNIFQMTPLDVVTCRDRS